MLRRLLAVLVVAPLFAVAASAQTATTVCKDGTTSATTGRGACTGHGGVDKSATKKATSAAKAEQKAAKAEQKAATKAEQKAATKAEQKAASKSSATMAAPAAEKVPANAPKQAAAATMRPAPAAAAPAAPARPTSAARPTASTTSASHAENNDPTGAIAQCKDGTYSHAASHRGACSRHQGVAKWL